MAIGKTSRPDMERDVFLEDPLRPTLPAKAVVVQNSAAEPVNVSGNVSFSGLSVALKITNATISTVAAKLPAVPLTGRNSLILENKSTTDSIFIGNSDVAASGTFEGWEVLPESFYGIDITNGIELYAIALVTSVAVKIKELA